MGMPNRCHPISESLIRGVFQGFRTTCHRYDSRPQKFHSKDIQRLPSHVFFAHIHIAFNPEHGSSSSSRHSMLSSPCLGNNSLFTHPNGKQYLTNCIIYLMCTCMIQVFPL